MPPTMRCSGRIKYRAARLALIIAPGLLLAISQHIQYWASLPGSSELDQCFQFPDSGPDHRTKS
ncbi:hypothetical protein DL89DRAFT_44787 [Linderina pennispora]|uniref:Uncharacterized protein n=1 Tax=Linderina pennispora TaxID=61395 RepID=A0A1Y1W1P4_9FUNG|nr:uncharacterized protein DL89DRAFT_44787 [Linderina pennispora]ORX67441.1 hypothetical protein DL89DRAFT_44787 [Linderina pennispora]